MQSLRQQIENALRLLLENLLPEEPKLVSFVVYGSVARGEAGPGSDVDLLLVFDQLPRGRQERFTHFYRALQAARKEASTWPVVDWSPVILTVEEAQARRPMYLDLVYDARLLFDRGGFFARVLEDMRARLEELGAKRIRLPGGSWYWDLKPDAKPGEVIEL